MSLPQFLSVEEYSLLVKERGMYTSDYPTSFSPIIKCCRGKGCCFSVKYPDVLCDRCKRILLRKGRIEIYSFKRFPDFF